MYSLIIGSLLISLLHAVIPNHWLPVLAIGRKEGWTLAETSRITFLAGLAHVISTVVIGLLLGMIGKEMTQHVKSFTRVVGLVCDDRDSSDVFGSDTHGYVALDPDSV